MFTSITRYIFHISEICSLRRIFSGFLAFLFGFCMGLAFVLLSAQIYGPTYDNAVLHTNHSSYMAAQYVFYSLMLSTNYFMKKNWFNFRTNVVETSIDKRLAQEVRVLCWIMTDPVNHQRKAKHVRDTWGKRCNILLFMTTKDGIMC